MQKTIAPNGQPLENWNKPEVKALSVKESTEGIFSIVKQLSGQMPGSI